MILQLEEAAPPRGKRCVKTEFGGFEETQAIPNGWNAESKTVTGRKRGCRGRKGPDHSVREGGGGVGGCWVRYAKGLALTLRARDSHRKVLNKRAA